MSDPWLVAGLGNPEDEYAGTRHNIGADVVVALAARHRTTLSTNRRTRCREATLRLGEHRVTLALPSGYMNESGGPTQAASAWVGAPPSQVVVVHDELDLDLGSIRCKLGGSSSHNGVRDVARALGTRDVLRVRVGIGRPRGRTPARDHVLGRFRSDEREEVEFAVEAAADAVESLVTDGLAATQNRFHGRQGSPS